MLAASSVNVKIRYKNIITRRNNISSLKQLHQVIEQLYDPKILPKLYILSYIDNENDDVQLVTEECFTTAIFAVHNNIYYKNDELKTKYNICDIQKQLLLLRITIHENAETIGKYKTKWSSTKGKNMVLSEDDMKVQIIGAYNQAIRANNAIPRHLVSKWSFIVFTTSDSGYFYGVVSGKGKEFNKPWYEHKESCAYGVDDNPAYLYEGAARYQQQWKKRKIPRGTEVELKMVTDYRKECCLLSVYMDDVLMAPKDQPFTLQLPPNQEWFPAVCLEDPNAWVRIVI